MKLWKDENQAYDEAINYIKNRHTGIETSIKTPWPKFNNALLDGFEWNTLTVIAARPATGKTMFKDQIITEAFLLNPNENFRVLELGNLAEISLTHLTIFMIESNIRH